MTVRNLFDEWQEMLADQDQFCLQGSLRPLQPGDRIIGEVPDELKPRVALALSVMRRFDAVVNSQTQFFMELQEAGKQISSKKSRELALEFAAAQLETSAIWVATIAMVQLSLCRDNPAICMMECDICQGWLVVIRPVAIPALILRGEPQIKTPNFSEN